MGSTETVRFGRYALEKRLAMGGMAEVFLGRIEGPNNFQKQVVIKRILPHLREDQRFVDMFVDEARLAARFNHPKLVQIYELAKVENQFCVAMEYIEGKDVASIMAQSEQRSIKVPMGIAAYVAAGVAEGLHYAHELTNESGEPLNVVHRDVSPANIIVTKHGGVKLFDFGIAKHDDRSSKTKANTLKGKLSYMSPEQIRRRNVDRRSDIFSLGIVLYELVTGERCLTGNSFMELLDVVGNAKYRDPKEIRPDLPPSFEYVLQRMLAADPDDRFQTAAEVQSALERVMDDVGSVAASDVPPFTDNLFADQFEEENVPVPMMDDDSIVVTGALSDPTVVVDPKAYQKILAQRIADQRRHTKGGSGSRRRKRGEQHSIRAIATTVATIAERLVQPSYWPTTLLVVAITVAVATGTLVVVYKQKMRDERTRNTARRTGVEAPPKKTATLHVQTVPSGAQVFVNGTKRAGPAPLTLRYLSVNKKHQLRFELDGYTPVTREIELKAGQNNAIRVTMAPKPDMTRASLTISTDPPGGLISINEKKEKLETPTTIDIEPGVQQKITGYLKGFPQQTQNVILDPGEESETILTFTKGSSNAITGNLNLESIPRADVFVNGNKIGTTPLRSAKMPPGPVVLELRSKQGGTKRVRLSIQKGRTVSRRVVFEKGFVLLDVKPWAHVYIGPRKVGTTPMAPIQLYAGTHTLRLVNPQLQIEREITVDIKPRETLKQRISFE